MTIISDAHKFVFILNPRTGCTATGNLLIEKYAGRWLLKDSIYDSDGMIVVPQKHSTLDVLLKNGVIESRMLSSYCVFSTIRNPFDSLVSLWVKKRGSYAELAKKDKSFFGYKKRGYMED